MSASTDPSTSRWGDVRAAKQRLVLQASEAVPCDASDDDRGAMYRSGGGLFGAVESARNRARQESALLDVLTKALIRAGGGGDDDDECRAKAGQLADALSGLYIRTPDELREAIDSPRVLDQVTTEGRIKGRLLLAVQEELKRNAVVTAWQKVAGRTSKRPERPLIKPLLRLLEVVRVDFTHIAEIDQVSQTFFARVLLVLQIKGGALDPDLSKESDAFPLDEYGQPTFRPSAKWYLNQLDFPNAKSVRTLESNVTVEGENLHLLKRVEGYFFERFKLHNFPYDEQDLAITVGAHCEMEGPVPVRFVMPGADDDDADPESDCPQLGVDVVNFAHADIWDLSPKIYTSMTTVGASSTRRFPAMHLRAHVKRRANFVVMNVAAPVSIISFLSLMTFFVPPEETADGLDLNFTILLTGVAFKYTTTMYLPQVSYTTLIDKFAFLCTLVIVISCVFRSVMGILESWASVSYPTLETLNKVFFGIMVVLWSSVQMWFILARLEIKTSKASKKKEMYMQRQQNASQRSIQDDRYLTRPTVSSQPKSVSLRKLSLQSEQNDMAVSAAMMMAAFREEDFED